MFLLFCPFQFDVKFSLGQKSIFTNPAKDALWHAERPMFCIASRISGSWYEERICRDGARSSVMASFGKSTMIFWISNRYAKSYGKAPQNLLLVIFYNSCFYARTCQSPLHSGDFQCSQGRAIARLEAVWQLIRHSTSEHHHIGNESASI